MITTVFAVSGAAGVTASSPLRESAGDSPLRVTAPEKCPRTIAAVRFYGRRLAYWAELRSGVRSATPAALTTCPRYLAHLLQRKARAARRAYERYLRSEAYQWDYERWMPAWMIRLGQCEMGLDWGRRWGIYEGAFAFAVSTWDGYKPGGFPDSAADATPRQQMIVVLRIARRLGVASPWGCWRGPQHAWVRGGLPEYGFYG